MHDHSTHHAEHDRAVQRSLIESGVSRRTLLRSTAVLAGAHWLTPVGQLLAEQEEAKRKKGDRSPAQSIILLWMAGGPSQLETFDPHPGSKIAAGTKAIPTAVKGMKFAEGYERLAEEAASLSIVRSLHGKEGDHERGTYTLKTGYRPDPTVVHPSLGAIVCHELPESFQAGGRTFTADVPRHVSILPNQWPGRGGYLGDQYDAFKTFDPVNPLPDVSPHVKPERFERRMSSLDVVDRAFARGRMRDVDKGLHKESVRNARIMMTSEQLAAFDVSLEPAVVRQAYGDTPFGRSCLAARRLIEVGVRCVEVTLDGWDTHANNHGFHKTQAEILDPAFASLIRDLRERRLLDRTLVLCVGEFGRTPRVNGLEGRDHWPHNFCAVMAGGGLNAGRTIGASDPEGGKTPVDPVSAADLHATALAAVGVPFDEERITPIQRPLRLSEGRPIAALLPS